MRQGTDQGVAYPSPGTNPPALAIGGAMGATVHLASAWWLSRPAARALATGPIKAA
ncbi:hypothetical protein [Embleya sp. NPDC005575]|uniref:hypothetical protein n=1 Tax=Embleya sp. NPDC005575 TaxID=3156892 RepID=UPI0033B0954A